MENTWEDIQRLQEEFRLCQKTLTALGDQTRQQLMLMMLGGPCGGSRVVDLAQRTNLSRPAVSHHIQILKDAGIVKVRREGTRLYYYLDPADSEIWNMIRLFQDIKKIMEQAPDRRGEEL